MKKKELFQRFGQVDIYPVTCEPLSNGKTDEEILEEVIQGGARIIQLRDKTSDKSRFYKKAATFREITAKNNILLIINDDVDTAERVNADGVHLGQDDTPLDEARKRLPEKIIGISSHNPEEARIAQEAGADYVNIGPVYSTKTKDGVCAAVGIDMIKEIAPTLRIPFTVMGGIKLDNLQPVLEAGARKVAVVTAITQSNNIPKTVQEFIQRIRDFSASGKL